ncbi:hypothetical protein QTP88_013501 [Uroleucon formosanum]
MSDIRIHIIYNIDIMSSRNVIAGNYSRFCVREYSIPHPAGPMTASPSSHRKLVNSRVVRFVCSLQRCYAPTPAFNTPGCCATGCPPCTRDSKCADLFVGCLIACRIWSIHFLRPRGTIHKVSRRLFVEATRGSSIDACPRTHYRDHHIVIAWPSPSCRAGPQRRVCVVKKLVDSYTTCDSAFADHRLLVFAQLELWNSPWASIETPGRPVGHPEKRPRGSALYMRIGGDSSTDRGDR